MGIIGFSFLTLFEKYVELGAEVNGAYKVNRIISGTDSNEIAIIGASPALFNYIPDSLGSNFFDYGLRGAKSDVMLFFMKEECKKQKKSPLLIVELPLEGFAKSLGDISNYIYNSDYPPIKTLLGEKFKIIYNIPLVKYFGNFETLFRNYSGSKTNFGDTRYLNKGASCPKNKLSPALFEYDIEFRKKHPFTFIQDSLLMNEFYEVIKDNPNRYFIFIVPPCHHVCLDYYKSTEIAKNFYADLNSKKNVRVIDFSKMNYPDSLFLDTSHLNYDGAKQFTSDLKDSLAILNYSYENGKFINDTVLDSFSN